MSELMRKDGPLTQILGRLFMVPPEWISAFIIAVQYDDNTAVVHTLCCDDHMREALKELAGTDPALTTEGYDPEGN